MQISVKSRWALGLFGLAAVYLLFVYVLPAFSAPSQGTKSEACIQPERQRIAQGESPGGSHWTITGTIKQNGGCDSWLFGLEFSPSGTAAGSFTWRWGVPASGHLSDRFTIGADDEAADAERVFGGAVGQRVNQVVMQMSNGGRIMIRPKLVPSSLRKRFVWLRNVRYFMRFYPSDRYVKSVTLLSADGKVVEKLRGLEGAFEGPGV